MTTQTVDKELIIGIKIAINVRGIISCNSKNSGKLPPNNTPARVEICQDINRVKPVPKRWKCKKSSFGSFINFLIEIA